MNLQNVNDEDKKFDKVYPENLTLTKTNPIAGFGVIEKV